MNRRQQIVLWVGIVAAALAFLFPCWRWAGGGRYADLYYSQMAYSFRYAPRPNTWAVIDESYTVVVLVVIASLTGMAVRRLRGKPKPRLPAVALHEEFDGRDVKKLIEALRYGNRYTRPDTRAALTRVLPRAQVTDVMRLADDDWAFLCTEIEHSHYRRDAEFLKALLHAMERAGPPSALRHVHYLADSDNPVLKRTGVQAAAQACLPALRERAERERIAGTLLRPVAEPRDLSVALLRPAPGEACADPASLLRSCTPEESA